MMRLQRSQRSRAFARALAASGAMLCVLSASAHPQSAGSPEALALPDLENRLKASRDAVRTYSEQLKHRITDAIRTGGLKGAIGSCKSLAPELNAAVADQTGVEIARTALRLRNPDNAPDAWETANLEAFVKQLSGGADAKTLEAFDVVTTKEGQRLFRYMKPIVTAEICLGCHGADIPQEIRLEIARNYPEDKATGYNLGEMRGAFSVVQEVE